MIRTAGVTQKVRAEATGQPQNYWVHFKKVGPGKFHVGYPGSTDAFDIPRNELLQLGAALIQMAMEEE